MEMEGGLSGPERSHDERQQRESGLLDPRAAYASFASEAFKRRLSRWEEALEGSPEEIANGLAKLAEMLSRARIEGHKFHPPRARALRTRGGVQAAWQAMGGAEGGNGSLHPSSLSTVGSALSLAERVVGRMEGKGVVQVPAVWAPAEGLGNDVAGRVSKCIDALKWKVASSEEEATHLVVEPAGNEQPISGTKQRLVMAEGDDVLVHSVGRSPFEDAWKRREEIPAGIPWEGDEVGGAEEPWRVTEGWVLACAKLSEWMDERDFLAAQPKLQAPQQRPGTKRFTGWGETNPPSTAAETVSQGRKRNRDDEVLDRDVLHPPKEVLGVAAADGTRPGVMGMMGKVVEGMSQGQVTRWRGVKSGRGSLEIPAYASWLDWESPTEVEKRTLPEFFDDRSHSKTPETYLRWRNHIIQRWRESAPKGITFTQIRRELAGDASAQLRLFEFLEHWGLINFRVVPENQPSLTMSAPAPPRPSSSLYDFGDSPGGPGHTGADLAARANVQLHQSGQVNCNATGVDLTNRARYHCVHQAHPDVDISPEAYAEGKFPPGLSSADFVRVEPKGKNSYDSSDWTDNELLALLEGIELYGDDWHEVASHVSTRNAHECLTRFLQLPIEDKALGDVASSASKPPTTSEEEPALPFADAGNPVMAHVAALTSLVGPKVAAAAAQAALKALEEEEGEGEGRQEGEGQVSREAMQQSAAKGLGAAAVKAKLLANQEEREVHRQVNAVLEQQVKKLDGKLKLLEELTDLLSRERDALAYDRSQALSERVKLQNERAQLSSYLQADINRANAPAEHQTPSQSQAHPPFSPNP